MKTGTDGSKAYFRTKPDAFPVDPVSDLISVKTNIPFFLDNILNESLYCFSIKL
jgi:hypothetical protein